MVCAVDDPADDDVRGLACVLLDVPAVVEDPGCEEDALVAMARVDWEICAEEREELPVGWEEAL